MWQIVIKNILVAHMDSAGKTLARPNMHSLVVQADPNGVQSAFGLMDTDESCIRGLKAFVSCLFEVGCPATIDRDIITVIIDSIN